MSELERMLVELGRMLPEPDAPPAARRVALRLREEQPARRLPVRAAIAIALGAAALAAAAAVPQARTSILRFFHLGGVSVERVEKLPPVSPRGPLAPGRETSLAEARARVLFPVLVPERLGTPSHTFCYGADPPGGQVTLVYGSLERPTLLVTEFLGTNAQGVFSKKAGRRTAVEQVAVDGSPGIWLGGAKHSFSFVDDERTIHTYETRLAGNTLVWQRRRLTLRLEGKVSKAKAIRLAESFERAH
jgi:hypothetical protein